MPIQSLYPPLDLPEVDVFSFLFNRKDREFPDEKVILRDGDDAARQYSYSQIRQASIDFGEGLKSKYDFRKGDVVAIFSPNDVDFPLVVFGTQWAGGVVSPANPGYTPPELAHQLKDSGAKLVVTQPKQLPTVLKACSQLNIPTSNIILMGPSQVSKQGIKHWKEICVHQTAPKSRLSSVNPKTDLAFLVYSSGTTGKPKGVRITHYNITSNIYQCAIAEGVALRWKGSKHFKGIPDAPADGDKMLTTLPFFHIYGLTHMVHLPVFLGITNIVMAHFNIEKWCSIVQDQGITFAYIVPPIAVLLSKHPVVDKYDLSSLRMTNSGAAPLTQELVNANFKRTGLRIKQGYGLSETSPTAFSQRWEDWEKAGANGRLVPNMEVKFCVVPGSGEYDESSPKEVGKGETGEIYLRGPNVFLGYHNNEAATRECIDKEGWFRTGDVGHLDEDGDLFITDRVKELIKYKGFQVPPAELEGYLVDHDLVDDVAVIGINSKELETEVPRAYIVRKGGLTAVNPGDDKTIIDWMNSRVANHKKLRGGIRFVESIPKSVSGKILRRVLKDQAKKEEEDGQLKAKL